ncbi:MAG: hypothetical protein U2P59_10185 [Synergistota bacterium]|nr:hypothetical protein [Synergistota bacterium]
MKLRQIRSREAVVSGSETVVGTGGESIRGEFAFTAVKLPEYRRRETIVKR